MRHSLQHSQVSCLIEPPPLASLLTLKSRGSHIPNIPEDLIPFLGYAAGLTACTFLCIWILLTLIVDSLNYFRIIVILSSMAIIYLAVQRLIWPAVQKCREERWSQVRTNDFLLLIFKIITYTTMLGMIGGFLPARVVLESAPQCHQSAAVTSATHYGMRCPFLDGVHVITFI